MGSIAGLPKFGRRGQPTPANPNEAFGIWFWRFLVDEMVPYPGRLAIVGRMVISATLTMVLIMTFRLPGAAIAGFYTLLLSRESPVTTMRSAGIVMAAYLLGTGYVLLSMILLVDYPLTHFLWVAASLFLCFYIIKISTNYISAAAFAFIITIAIPIWDVSLPTNLLVAATLWAGGTVAVGLAVTVVVEYVFSLARTEDELTSGLLNRMRTVASYLEALGQRRSTAEPEKKISQMAMAGISRLRRLAISPSLKHADAAHRSTTISLVGRLVDLCATIPESGGSLTDEDAARLRAVAKKLTALQGGLTGNAQLPDAAEHESRPAQFPLLPELERTTDLLAMSLGSDAGEPQEREDAPKAFYVQLVPDAFSNPEHLSYAVRGCLAATLCYFAFNAIEWRGLSTSLATCVITALSSVGSSRQKQVLRISGAAFGGLVLGIGSQVFILPKLDSLAGFTVLFASVTFLAAWLATASPRLSYFGLQVALAFDLINLQEYFPQTNLAIGRDRVVGIALGLAAMWLVFDTLGAKPASRVMCEMFANNFRLLARLANPWRPGEPLERKQIRDLRDQVTMNFSAVNTQADGVLFETGPDRPRALRTREHLLRWQPRLRSLFLLQIAELHYRVQVSPESVAPGVVEARRAFDAKAEQYLSRLGEVFAGQAPTGEPIDLRAALRDLEGAAKESYPDPNPRVKAVLAITDQMTDLLEELGKEIGTAEGLC